MEQRQQLAKLAETTIERAQVSNAEIIHANVTEIEFGNYDAFYLFNPFEENLFKTGKIDSSVKLSRALYAQYTRHVAAQFARAPMGTRVVTFGGLCEEVPICYECQRSSFGGTLKLWQKTNDDLWRDTSLDARVTRNRWRFFFDFACQERELRAAIGGSEAP